MTRSPSRRFKADAQPAPRRLNRFFTAIVLGGIGLFVLDAAWKALRAPWAVDDFPEALAVKVELLPWLFPLHMITGGLALVLVPLALAARLRPRWHRLAGWIAAPVCWWPD